MPWIEIILLVIITTPIGLVIHELGHFVAARVLMLEVVSFQAGPFLIDWKNGESTFRFRPLLWLSAGAVRTKVSVETPAKKRILLTAAGPAASLLFSGIYRLAPVTDINVMDETDFLQWLLLLLAANSFVIFLLTAFPLRAARWNYQGGPTDGYKILTLIRSMNTR
jgi:membrane-associated protease RseP (regulator of RpoE activity)